ASLSHTDVIVALPVARSAKNSALLKPGAALTAARAGSMLRVNSSNLSGETWTLVTRASMGLAPFSARLDPGALGSHECDPAPSWGGGQRGTSCSHSRVPDLAIRH